AAWRLLQEHLDEPRNAPLETEVLAARAAGEWGGWRQARELLLAHPRLEEEGGEGLFLLARAEEELGNDAGAVAAYRRYLSLRGGEARAVAQVRLGRILAEAGDARGAAEALAAAAPLLPEVQDWLAVLRLEQLARLGDPTVAERATRGVGGSSPVRLRRVRAEVEGWTARGDLTPASGRPEWEARVRGAQGARDEATRLHLDRARLLLRADRAAEARELLRATAWETSLPKELRLAAAQELGEMEGLSAAEELARAAAYEAAGRPGLAARS